MCFINELSLRFEYKPMSELINAFFFWDFNLFTGEEVSIDKQVACEECPRWLKMTEVACEKTEVAVC